MSILTPEYRDVLMNNVTFVERDMEDERVPKHQRESLIQIRGELALFAVQSIHKREIYRLVDSREEAKALIRTMIRATLYHGIKVGINTLGEEFLMGAHCTDLRSVNKLMNGLYELFPRVR